jgi:hypothetical protein
MCWIIGFVLQDCLVENRKCLVVIGVIDDVQVGQRSESVRSRQKLSNDSNHLWRKSGLR